MVTIGRVIGPRGIKGEVKVWPETDFPERFLERKRLFLEGPEPRWVEVESVRFHQGSVLIKLMGINDRNGAETLRGYCLQVPAEEIPPLSEGRYYHFQLMGMTVKTTTGLPLGTLKAILSTDANDVFVVEEERGGREYLIPALREVVTSVDLATGTIVVAPLAGLLE